MPWHCSQPVPGVLEMSTYSFLCKGLQQESPGRECKHLLPRQRLQMLEREGQGGWVVVPSLPGMVSLVFAAATLEAEASVPCLDTLSWLPRQGLQMPKELPCRAGNPPPPPSSWPCVFGIWSSALESDACSLLGKSARQSLCAYAGIGGFIFQGGSRVGLLPLLLQRLQPLPWKQTLRIPYNSSVMHAVKYPCVWTAQPVIIFLKTSMITAHSMTNGLMSKRPMTA